MLAEIATSALATVQGWLRLSFMAPEIVAACASSHPEMKTANSSPPRRAKNAFSGSTSLIRPALTLSTLSPA